ncbi:MAG TPA: signal peptidase I [Candidatus Nitrosotalea sp.]|nr:signal peptidase I [Candidatus Nitrosotalea sp.]
MSKLSLKSGIVKDIIIVVIGIAIIWIGLRVAFGTENPFYVVSSGSMIPNLEIFDVIVVQGHVNFDQLKVGDIIVFNRPDGHDKVIVHRVAEILNKDPLVIRTKGDANPGSIPGTDFPITKDDYIGKVVYVIPQIGYVTRILTPPINYIIIAVIVGIMLVKQLGKPKSTGNVFGNDKDQKDSDESGTDPDKSLSNDKSYLTDESGTGPDKNSVDDKSDITKDSDKSKDKDSELK